MLDFLGDVASFLTDGAHWHGAEGIPTLFLQHLQLTAVSVLGEPKAGVIAVMVSVGVVTTLKAPASSAGQVSVS